MKTSPSIRSKTAKRWTGQPVYVMLKDGSCLAGWLTGVDGDQITLSASKSGSRRKMKVTGYMPGMFGAGGWGFNPYQPYNNPMPNQVPGAGSAAAAGSAPVDFVTGFGNFMGTVRKVWPDVQFGINMVKTILPMMKGLGLKL